PQAPKGGSSIRDCEVGPVNGSHALLLEAGTAVIADVFDTLDILPPVLDTSLFPVTGPGTRFCGPAYTIRGETNPWSGGGDRRKLAAIDAMPPGCVPVWAGTDIRGVCCFGDLLSEAMKARGCAGVVVDGGVRDTGFLRQLGLPVLARYRTPAQSIGRWRVTAVQEPVQVRGALEDWVSVSPGDLVVADDDGVIVIPAAREADVVQRVERWMQKDGAAREDIRRGMPLLEALDKHGHL
ncbi:MAG TPA: RraA family protein, partial [Bacillota bacterium]